VRRMRCVHMTRSQLLISVKLRDEGGGMRDERNADST
jgi:hypothetical protein